MVFTRRNEDFPPAFVGLPEYIYNFYLKNRNLRSNQILSCGNLAIFQLAELNPAWCFSRVDPCRHKNNGPRHVSSRSLPIHCNRTSTKAWRGQRVFFFGGVNLLSWKWTDISKKHQKKKRMKKNGTVFWSILRPRLSSIFAVKLEFHARNLIVINVQKPLDWDDGWCKDIGFAKTQPASSVHDFEISTENPCYEDLDQDVQKQSCGNPLEWNKDVTYIYIHCYTKSRFKLLVCSKAICQNEIMWPSGGVSACFGSPQSSETVSKSTRRPSCGPRVQQISQTMRKNRCTTRLVWQDPTEHHNVKKLLWKMLWHHNRKEFEIMETFLRGMDPVIQSNLRP